MLVDTPATDHNQCSCIIGVVNTQQGTLEMGSILISVPDIADADLLYDEAETRQILEFFWPHKASEIKALEIDNDGRRLAQTTLIAAIDGTYAIGFVKAMFETTVNPRAGVRAWARKLAGKYVKHWWKHADQRDLRHVKIYESVRIVVAGALKRHLDLLQNGLALQRPLVSSFYAVVGSTRAAWS